MSLIKSLLNILVPKSLESKTLVSEEDILKAIDALTVEKPKVEESITEDINYVKVVKPKCWADFKYLGKPEFKGLPNITEDPRIYFTIPCGFEWDRSIKFWFVTFPANCIDTDIKEFFTVVDPVDG